ncbi:PREDICTED: mucin-19 isoform X1 [Drosophila arizonae]|uniref:Mucin-19 isoform X1 n=1 Tax=Drosophila arizonae TaxID=7263 RepID=A0ABM1P3Z2_DROAR|nr:PREDICTED: mucin-19 isoform X1 [Drosophila arizonae]XP_017861929.1 PREDICTED: mucin-19 isoform X1 [Drosophila arizonae]XP_017861930.1 PREDICTED: mucin-19 isoform X1 [Drosophila arizonae]
MTSYANDTTSTAAATTTTTTTIEGAATNAGAITPAAPPATAPAAAVGAAAKQVSNNNSNDNGEFDEDDNSLDGREKADTTPENLKKIAEIINDKEAAAAAAATATSGSLSPRLQHQQHLNASSFVGLGAAIDESNTKFCLGKPPPSPAEKAAVLGRANHRQSSNSNKESDAADVEEESTASTSTATKQSLAFTIDHFDASENDSAAQAARYKNMMERFQNRHRRGASMSKLESEASSANSANGRQSQRSSLDASSVADDASVAATPTTEAAPAVRMRVRERSASRVRDASKRHSWSPRSSATTEPPTRVPSQKPKQAQPAPPKGTSNMLANRTAQFTPRSTAMQLALKQVELLCPHPPLSDMKSAEDDAVSEAGTYTLDGDNYTEEQKDLMNIDRNAAAAAAAAAATATATASAKLRPKQLAVKPNRASNVLEVNYYHETPQQEQKGNSSSANATGAYLEQLKSRALHTQAPPTPPSPRSPAADVGCFTSVTTSGVLAKQRALDTHPKLTRHSHSLSTSQIDSSEYVSNEAKLRHAQAQAIAGSATDRQKAEYRLNVFTSSNNQQQQQQQQQQQLHQLPETPTTPTEAALLQSAPTKQDWIQEWARNARARSLAQDVSGSSANRRKQQAQAQAQAQQLMTRSYNCSDTGADSLTDDSLSLYNQQQQRQYAAAAKLNRSLAERYRLLGDCDYASDPALCSPGQMPGEPYKPPKSPSKIPSPLHTLGRARSASRSRPAMEQMPSQTNSRRSSVKSPANQCSPQHSLETSAGYRRSPLHRALMTSSINEAQLQLLTSGEYLLKQLHRRKNSLDDVEHVELPTSSAGSISPLRRSSSFQRPLQNLRQARPNFQNLYTPPAARHLQHQQQQQQQQLQLQLKKSASSNNFDQSYSDYDNELQYYINDEDELGTTGPYYSSGEEEDELELEHHHQQQQQQQQQLQQRSRQAQQTHNASDSAVPLTNTRLNKALLMRIERSKQRVAGSGAASATGQGLTPSKPSSAPAGKLSAAAQAAAAGLVACPNTPELPRRGIKSAQPRAASGCGPKLRQSMPRETSLSRLAQQVPSSLANAKKQLLQTASATSNMRVQPKYLDISKYKSAQSNNFLRKNDAKSTLKPAEQMKRSPSASSMGLSRGDGTRASNRSVRSNTSVMNSSTTSLGGGGGMRASSSVRRDASVNKQKEAEMVMWKRRSTYDPMKAAAEDRRRKEEARRAQTQAQAQQQYNNVADDVPFESVLRPANNLTITGSINYSPRNSMENDAWTLGESSEFGEYPEDYEEDDVDGEDPEQEREEYAAGQESDEVFEAETAEATA